MTSFAISSSFFSSLNSVACRRISPVRLCRPCRRLISTNKPITVLALESSADDSCCSIVTSDRRVLSNVVIKQHLLNAKHGGIHPLRAQEAHASGVPLAITQALTEAGMRVDDVDAVAYTRGPGMYGCLSVAAGAAKALAASAKKPIFGIHHMQAHALTPLLTEKTPPSFPFLVLLVSGGHTQLVLARGLNDFKILANTLDISVGDAFDKAARLLNLPISPDLNPGALLEHYASLPPLSPFDVSPLKRFPIPLSQSASASKEHKRQYDGPVFSFSGLLAHTERAARWEIEKGVQEEAIWREVGKRFQVASVGHLVEQIKGVIGGNSRGDGEAKEGQGGDERVKGLVVSGGVASNLYLRQKLQEMADDSLPDQQMKLYYPPLELCTDNAAMIAWAAILRIQAGSLPEGYDLPIRPKWSLESLYDDLP